MDNYLNIAITKKQKAFIDATADEVLYGGAAGGGKSYAQLIDALLYALKYPKSKQLILRRTFPELDKTMVRGSLQLYPQRLYTYTGNTRTGRFVNGSLIDFGYCDAENDVHRYQGAEYDVIRFDELTHFTEYQYTYLMSRIRGTNNYPKQIKCSTNPGNIGHTWVKARFVDPAPPCEVWQPEGHGRMTTRVYIPATVFDNKFIMDKDPDYITRLQNLPEKERKALLNGDWNIFDGVRFTAFDTAIHVINPFEIPQGWRRYRAIDYGLDRLACYWIAMDADKNCYVYKELCESNLIISDACQKIRDMTYEDIYCTLAPPDLWARGQESGKSRALIFADNGVPLVKVSNDRPAGWSAVDELIKVTDGKSRLKIFANCRELITCLPQLQIDTKKPDDVMTEPHEITHAPDALRYFAVWWASPAKVEPDLPKIQWDDSMREDWRNASRNQRKMLEQMWGKPPRGGQNVY